MSSTYNNTKELRFWCQKVLPLVYDDSLSYYELLNKIVVYLNSTIEDVQAMIADVTRIEQGLSSKIDLSQKGVANGVATLNGQGQVPLTQLPDISAGVQTISVNGVNVPADENKNVNIIVMTNAVSNLVNYYLKSETYNKTEVNALIDNVKNSRFEVVAQLPTTDIQTNVIYLVPKSVGQTQNGYDEFINLDGTTSGWELIGSTDIDLSGYVTDSELATALSAYVTTQSLNTTLAGYVTSGALATTLEGYVTNATFQTLSGTVTSQGETLAGLVTAVNNKVDKVAGKGLSTNDYSNTDKGVVDKIQDNVIANTKLIKDTVGWSGKNKFPNKTNTIGNNTYTVDSDGYVSTNVVSDTRSWSYENSNIKFTLKKGTYKVRGFEKTASSSGYTGLQIADDNNVNLFAVNNWNDFMNNALTLTLTQDTNIGVEYKIGNGVYAFMIYDADILDDTYEPYAGTTAFPRSEQAVLGAKNLLRETITTYTGNGVTFTVNEDGSITVNGTATAETFAPVFSRDYVPELARGRYILSGGIARTADYEFYLNERNADDTDWGRTYFDETGKGVLYERTTDVRYSVIIHIKNGKTVNNLTFYPMIRLATDADDTYVSYAMTNRELTEKKADNECTVIQSVDLNDFKSNGKYRLNGSITNTPSPNYGFMIVLA